MSIHNEQAAKSVVGQCNERIFVKLSILRQVTSSLTKFPNFRLLWISNLFFFSGVWTQTLVLGWLVFEMTGSELSVAVFTTFRLAPMMLGPLSGVVSDRFDRVRLLLAASAWGFVTVGTIATLVLTDAISYWGVVVGGFCLGMAQSPFQPARTSLLADYVERGSLSNAGALNSIAMNISQIIGPAIGGAMVASAGAGIALWVSALWYVVSFVALWPLRGTDLVRIVRTCGTLRKLLTAGARSALSNRLVSSVLMTTLASNILLWPVYHAFMPVFAKGHLGLDAEGLGWMLTCSGLGGLAGCLVIATLGDFKYKGALFVVGTTIWGALWAAFAVSQTLPISFALITAIGFASAPFTVLQATLLLMMTEPQVQGRVLGLQELAIGVMPVATISLGVTAELFGVVAVTLVSSMMLVTFLGLLAVRVPELLRYSGQKPQTDPPTTSDAADQ